ncbi:MAG: putative ABC transporter permease [Clostridia bacterium]
METNLFNLWTYFIIYSICGWILESVYRSFREKKIINTGFLNGPMCPIYGIGAIIMILFLGKFSKNIIVLFLVSFIVLSIWEYIVGVYLEKTFKTKYWDYSDHKINIKGRVCLSNSICWGILGVLFIKYIHPFIKHEISLINLNVLRVIVLIITLIFVIDTIMSIVKTKNIKETLQKVEELNNQIKEKLEELKKIKTKKETNDIISKNQLSIEKLKKKKNRLLRSLYWRVYRLKKAFPTLDTKEIREILEKKIEVIKKSQKK